MSYGSISADILTTSTGQTIGASSSATMKNRIINGGMVIDQRNNGASVTNQIGNTYTVDRWAAVSTVASKFTSQQNAGGVAPPSGFVNYLGMTSLSAYTPTSTDYLLMQQRIEGFNTADLGWGTLNAKTVTLSFWVYSSLTGTNSLVIANNGFSRTYPVSFNIPTANTWTYISLTIPGDTTGTWLTNNGIGINVSFNLGSGSSVSGTSGVWSSTLYTATTGSNSIVSVSGATFYITGVQLEVGTEATSFDYRDIGREFAMCWRYCWVLYGNSSNETELGIFTQQSNNTAYWVIFNPVIMRSSPSVTSIGSFQWTQTGSQTSFTPSFAISTPYSILGIINNTGSLTAGTGGRVSIANTTSSGMIISSEL